MSSFLLNQINLLLNISSLDITILKIKICYPIKSEIKIINNSVN